MRVLNLDSQRVFDEIKAPHVEAAAPTGSGKTLAMLAFALRHAMTHPRLRRIVVVIPYLSIIDQTAKEYRRVLQTVAGGDSYVLEDHSMARAESYGEEQDEARLAENWDAPVVVTTSVQFLEFLFSNRGRGCRKLHRLANSIVLLDEVQTLSQSIVLPTLATLSHLTSRYGATVVFSTATQPAFGRLHESVREYGVAGWSPREIAPPALGLFGRLQRTRIRWPRPGERTTWVGLGERIASLPEPRRALCIVNLKRHALDLHETLKKVSVEGLYHISTSMCPAHRRAVLEQVRHRLASDHDPCSLVSTQCIEAGVDIDFPLVFRAVGPLEAIAQAAGRCNRHGAQETGTVEVFLPENEGYPPGPYKTAASISSGLARRSGDAELDLEDQSLFQEYYGILYAASDIERQNTELREAILCGNFVDTSRFYRVVDQNSINVLVPHDISVFSALADELRRTGLNRSWMRRARPHTVSVFLARGKPLPGYLEKVRVGADRYSEDWFVLANQEIYSPETGLTPKEEMDFLCG